MAMAGPAASRLSTLLPRPGSSAAVDSVIESSSLTIDHDLGGGLHSSLLPLGLFAKS
jgi:hypothetical protein